MRATDPLADPAQVFLDRRSVAGQSSAGRSFAAPTETFRANAVGDGQPDDVAVVPPGNGIPPATLIMPRRNNGPIVQPDAAAGTRVDGGVKSGPVVSSRSCPAASPGSTVRGISR